MSYRTIKKRLKRYRHRNQPYYPGAFRALDFAVESSKVLLLLAVFGTIFYTI